MEELELSFQSYSQYGEDAVIFGVLSPSKTGTYVDVGAFHPVRWSNTYALYRRGWSGVTIEPSRIYEAHFLRLRPRDKHISCGVAIEFGHKAFYQYADSSLNTFDLESTRDEARCDQAYCLETVAECRPLSDILAESSIRRPLDLLNVDAEGSDFSVLESLDWEAFRPAVVIIEDYKMFYRAASGDKSPISRFMTAHGYACFSNCLFSYLYIDGAVRSGHRHVDAFDHRVSDFLPTY
jgi:FkbM family methyltransferase